LEEPIVDAKWYFSVKKNRAHIVSKRSFAVKLQECHARTAFDRSMPKNQTAITALL
jgi:hypothetical protein